MHYECRPVRCNICGGDDYRILGYRGGEAHRQGYGIKSRIVQCRSCTLIYPNPMPFPGDLQEQYHNADEYFINHELATKQKAGLYLMSEYARRLGRAGSILDVGCGRGEMLWAAQQVGWHAEGLDVSPDFVEFARKQFGVNAKLGSLEESHFGDGTFDAVALGAVLEHLYDPRAVVTEVARILRPNGFLWLDVPNEAGLYFGLGNLYMRLNGRDWVVNLAPTFSPFHIYGFTPQSIHKLLTQVGFREVEISIYNGQSLVPRRKGISGWVEQKASLFAHALSSNKFGNYMNIWAQR